MKEGDISLLQGGEIEARFVTSRKNCWLPHVLDSSHHISRGAPPLQIPTKIQWDLKISELYSRGFFSAIQIEAVPSSRSRVAKHQRRSTNAKTFVLEMSEVKTVIKQAVSFQHPATTSQGLNVRESLRNDVAEKVQEACAHMDADMMDFGDVGADDVDDVRQATRHLSSASREKRHKSILILHEVCDLVDPSRTLFRMVLELLIASCCTRQYIVGSSTWKFADVIEAAQLKFSCSAEGLAVATTATIPLDGVSSDDTSASDAFERFKVLREKFFSQRWMQRGRADSEGSAIELSYDNHHEEHHHVRDFLGTAWLDDLNDEARAAVNLFHSIRHEIHTRTARISYLTALRNGGEALVTPSWALQAAGETDSSSDEQHDVSDDAGQSSRNDIPHEHETIFENDSDTDYDFDAVRKSHPDYDFLRHDRQQTREEAAATEIQRWLKRVHSLGLFRGLAQRMRPENHRKQTALIVRSQASVRRFLHRVRAKRRAAAALAYKVAYSSKGDSVTSEADLEDLHSRIAALRTSHESGEHESTTAGSDTTPPLSGSAYDRSLVELAAIREAAAAAKLRSLTDRLLAAVHRLQRQKPTDHSLSAFSNGAHLYRSRQLKYFTQLKSLVTEAARYLNADNQSLVVARAALDRFEFEQLPPEEQLERKRVDEALQQQERDRVENEKRFQIRQQKNADFLAARTPRYNDDSNVGQNGRSLSPRSPRLLSVTPRTGDATPRAPVVDVARRIEAFENLRNAVSRARSDDGAMGELASSLAYFQDLETEEFLRSKSFGSGSTGGTALGSNDGVDVRPIDLSSVTASSPFHDGLNSTAFKQAAANLHLDEHKYQQDSDRGPSTHASIPCESSIVAEAQTLLRAWNIEQDTQDLLHHVESQ